MPGSSIIDPDTPDLSVPRIFLGEHGHIIPRSELVNVEPEQYDLTLPVLPLGLRVDTQMDQIERAMMIPKEYLLRIRWADQERSQATFFAFVDQRQWNDPTVEEVTVYTCFPASRGPTKEDRYTWGPPISRTTIKLY